MERANEEERRQRKRGNDERALQLGEHLRARGEPLGGVDCARIRLLCVDDEADA